MGSRKSQRTINGESGTHRPQTLLSKGMKMEAKKSMVLFPSSVLRETSWKMSMAMEAVMGASCRRSVVSQKSPTQMSTWPSFTSQTHLPRADTGR